MSHGTKHLMAMLPPFRRHTGQRFSRRCVHGLNANGLVSAPHQGNDQHSQTEQQIGSRREFWLHAAIASVSKFPSAANLLLREFWLHAAIASVSAQVHS